MAKISTTAGRLLLGSVIPADIYDPSMPLDKANVAKLMRQVGERYPEKYKDISFQLMQLGFLAAERSGGYSFGIKHLLKSKSAKRHGDAVRTRVEQILDRDDLTDAQRDGLILKTLDGVSQKQSDEVYEESLAENNPLAMQLKGAGRGNKTNLSSLRGSDLLYVDHKDRPIPIPVLRSYSEGLTPAEYWAGAYGARKGVIDTKLAVADAGFLSKQINQVSHRLVVTKDDEEEGDTLRGFPVDVDDDESEGSLLAADIGGYRRNTILSPKILHDLRQRGIKRILVRSASVGGSRSGGVLAKDVGIREFGRLPGNGELVGLVAAQALSEPLAQAQLSSKHSGGVAGASSNRAVSGFAAINQLVQVPKTIKGGATHSDHDGTVTKIEVAPAGGHYVYINNNQHYIPEGLELKVKRGQMIEAGDVLSEGLPNPAAVVKHKGIGEGRRYFVDTFRQTMRDAGIKGHRRNIELLSRGLIDHVRLTEEVAGGIPNDIVPYSSLERDWEPREGNIDVAPKQALGKYLERPYLHHSIGTKIKPSMLPDFETFGISKLTVHNDPPPFEPEMLRAMDNLSYDPDWQTKMLGSGLKKSLLKSVQRGATSDETGTSYVPSLAKAVNFGQIGPLAQPPRRSVLLP